MTILERFRPADIARAVESRPGLGSAVRRIARETGLREDVVREYLGQAVRESLERLGERYVREMSGLISNVEHLRERVNQFYERVLTGQDTNPDTALLTSLFSEMHQDILQLTDPQLWAQEQSRAGDLLRVMAEDQRRGVSRHGQPLGGEGTYTEGLGQVEQNLGTGRIPRSKGGWDGEPGNSGWVSQNLDVVRVTLGEPVQYVHSEPILKPYATEQVVLSRMTGDNKSDFQAAREGLMRQFPTRWRDAAHVEAWEMGGMADSWGNSLSERQTWHHEPDVETMTLVPTALHSKLPHTGGASAARRGATPAREAPFSAHPL